MACVLTGRRDRDGRAIVGHVGDTRLYKLRRGRIEKVTRDHSPVGEREDARELSELEAMQHPRRNEVYRDVGSEPHEPGDPDFIDVQEIPFEPDAALLLCSDGLTDLVDSASINADRRGDRAGRPQQVVAGADRRPPTTPAARTTSRSSTSRASSFRRRRGRKRRGQRSPPREEITRRLGTVRRARHDTPAHRPHAPTSRSSRS